MSRAVTVCSEWDASLLQRFRGGSHWTRHSLAFDRSVDATLVVSPVGSRADAGGRDAAPSAVRVVVLATEWGSVRAGAVTGQ